MGLARWLQELVRGRGAIYESCCTGTGIGTGTGICEAAMQRERSALFAPTNSYQFLPVRLAAVSGKSLAASQAPPL